jgi:hypothetical protein
MANNYMNQHKMMAMGMAVSGQKMVNGGPKKGMVDQSKGVKGDPKATPAIISKGKQNA